MAALEWRRQEDATTNQTAFQLSQRKERGKLCGAKENSAFINTFITHEPSTYNDSVLNEKKTLLRVPTDKKYVL